MPARNPGPGKAKHGFRGYRRVLAVGAHPDDIELGCGGSLCIAQRAGLELHAAVLSRCEDESPRKNPNLRGNEFLRACGVTGAKPHVFRMPNRELPENRREVMNIMESLQEGVSPDLVFIPFLDDPHQDHSTVAQAAIRTFRRNETVLQYEILRHGSHSFAAIRVSSRPAPTSTRSHFGAWLGREERSQGMHMRRDSSSTRCSGNPLCRGEQGF